MRWTGSQVGRNRNERLIGVRDAFAVRGMVPSSVILVDDLSTTGSTLDECAKVLKNAGVKSVQGLVLAHG
jgi:predicted amidophosphoribosyltransferase